MSNGSKIREKSALIIGRKREHTATPLSDLLNLLGEGDTWRLQRNGEVTTGDLASLFKRIRVHYDRIYLEETKPLPWQVEHAAEMILERLRWSAREVWVNLDSDEATDGRWHRAIEMIRSTGIEIAHRRENNSAWAVIPGRKNKYALAIVVTIHNRYEITTPSIESLLASWIPPCHLVIVDDGSDDTRIPQWLDGLDTSPHRLHLIRQDRIGAYWRVINRAWSYIDGLRDIEYVAVCDNDFLYHPWWFLTGLLRFESFPHEKCDRFPGAFTAFHLGPEHCRHPYTKTFSTPFGALSLLESGWLRNFVIPEPVRRLVGPLTKDGGEEYIRRLYAFDRTFIGTIPSYVQHIGGKSSLYGHSGDPDTAPDFIGEKIEATSDSPDAASSFNEISLPVKPVMETTGRPPGTWKIIHQDAGTITSTIEYAHTDLRNVVRELSRSRSGRHPILVVSIYGLGDALMMGPALDALHAKFPHCPLHIMCGTQEHIMFLHDPSIATIIAGPWNPRMERLVGGFYHHAYMMGPWLTQNPDAFWKNGYEIACEQLLVEPEQLLPRFHFTREEETRVKDALSRLGIDSERNNVILIHGESSSLVRRWPLQRVIETAENMAKGGNIAIIAATRLYSEYSRPPDIPNVLFTAREFADLTTREALLLTKHVDLVIAVDSVFSHLSAAFNKPAVLLFGAFDPAIRAKHFPFAHIVQSDVPCGPCHQHTPRCHLDELNDVPKCMDAISVEEVSRTAIDVLEGRGEPTSLKTIEFDESDVPPCPLCKSPVSHFAWRKRDVFYQKCDSCGTLFRPDSIPSDGLFVPWRQHWIDISKRGGRMQIRGVLSHLLTVLEDLLPDKARRSALDIGAGKGAWCVMLHKDGWQCDAYEPDEDTARELEDLGIRNLKNFSAGQKGLSGNKSYDAVFFMHQMMYVTDLNDLMRIVDSSIAPGGLLVLSSPVADYASYNEAWPLNREVAGANLIIPSIRGLDIFMQARGYETLWHGKIRQRVSEIIVWRKP